MEARTILRHGRRAGAFIGGVVSRTEAAVFGSNSSQESEHQFLADIHMLASQRASSELETSIDDYHAVYAQQLHVVVGELALLKSSGADR